MIARPRDLFDREREWADLAKLVDGARAGVTLGVVYGRRRQGKSWLLRRIARATSGTYHQALEETRSLSLDRFAETIANGLALPAGRARTGFSADLRREAASRKDVELVDLERLYDGD